MTGPLGDGALECMRPNGDVLRFDPETEEFGVRSAAGRLATYMILRPLPSARQTALEYFQSQCKQRP